MSSGGHLPVEALYCFSAVVEKDNEDDSPGMIIATIKHYWRGGGVSGTHIYCFYIPSMDEIR